LPTAQNLRSASRGGKKIKSQSQIKSLRGGLVADLFHLSYAIFL
jgi:hypothetical protein